MELTPAVRKYPRTPHLPFSRSKTSDDITGSAWDFLKRDLEVVISEKMDGECTSLYANGFHARSMDSGMHPSRSWMAAFHGGIAWQLPAHRRIVMENVFAEHSIRYDNLPTFAFGIAVIDLLDKEGNPSLDGAATYLSWDDTLEVFADLGITPVPVLYRGSTSLKHLEEVFSGLDFSTQEGIVVRTAGSFLEEDFQANVAKSVRTGHVQTDEHWLRTWKPNKLASVRKTQPLLRKEKS